MSISEIHNCEARYIHTDFTTILIKYNSVLYKLGLFSLQNCGKTATKSDYGLGRFLNPCPPFMSIEVPSRKGLIAGETGKKEIKVGLILS